MIQAAGTFGPDARPFLLLGLSDENWRRMRELGQPVKFAADILGRPGDVVIIGGADEAELAEMIERAGLLGPDTRRVYHHGPPGQDHPGPHPSAATGTDNPDTDRGDGA